MPVLPQLGEVKILTQRPYVSRLSFRTIKVDMPHGRRWSFPLVGSGLLDFPENPLGEFVLNFPVLTDGERDGLVSFYRARKGMYEEFEFFDPGGNLVRYSEDFSNSYWTGSFSGGAVTDPYGGSKAASSGGGSLSGIVAPNGGISGFRLCASIWCKPTGASSMEISLTGGGSSVTALRGGTWTRAFHTAEISGSGVISVTFDPGGSMALFGAQVSSMLGEGGYVKSPANFGWHERCRFDSPEISVIRLGPNHNSLTIPVAELYA